MKNVKLWSPEEEQTLLKLKGEGLNFEAIAEKLGKSVGACRVKWGRLKAKTATGETLKPNETLKPKTGNDVLEEFLSALQTLYPKHKRICLVMLRNANLFLEGEKP